MRRAAFAIPFLVGLTACAEQNANENPPEAQFATDDSRTFARLAPEAHLLRASVLLRGIRPSLQEYERLETEGIEALIDDYLASEDFRFMASHMVGEWLLTNPFKLYYPMNFPAVGDLADVDVWTINASIAESPSRFAAHVITEDLPYSELVRADYLFANDIVAKVWGLDYDAEEGGWQQVPFSEDRPAAGILSDPWYFTRHASTPTNRQRARAAHVARALLCHDYMSRQVRVPADVDLTAGGDNSLQENQVCVSCHSTLDEFGAFFTQHEGVVFPELQYTYPITSFSPEPEAGYPDPSFYGVPGDGLESLGNFIAEDPRFARCAVRRFYGKMMGLDEYQVPREAEERFVGPFLDSGLRVKALLKDIILSDEFAANGSDGANDVRVTGLRRIGPVHIERTLVDLAGFEWNYEADFDYGTGTIGTVPLLADVFMGYRSLAGGADGFFRFEPLRTADPTTLLVLRETAAYVATQVVDDQWGESNDALLQADPEAGESEIKAELVRLHLRLFGERVTDDSDEIQAAFTVFTAADGLNDSREGWKAVLFAMLQHPRMLYL